MRQADDEEEGKTFSSLITTPLLSPRLQNVVVMQLALVVAVVFKRGWIEESDAEKQTVFALIVDLIGGGSAAKYRRIGFMLLTALVSEFSSEKASAIGLPWDFHNQCKKTFENTTLIQMFEFTLGQLRPLLENVISSGADPSLLKLALGILDQILSWEFCPEHAGNKRIYRKFSHLPTKP